MDNNNNSYEVISWQHFDNIFKPSFEMPFYKFYKQLDKIQLYNSVGNEDINFKGNLIINYSNSVNLVIDGDLNIEGNLCMNCDEGVANFIFINGNLRAKSIILDGYPSLKVKGKVDVENGILGMYGDDGGYLDIQGEVNGKVVIADSGFNMKFKSTVNAVILNNSNMELEADYYGEDLETIFLSELIDDEECIDTDEVVDYLLNDKNILNFSKISEQKINFDYKDMKLNLKTIKVNEALKKFPILKEKIEKYGEDTDEIAYFENDIYWKGNLEMNYRFDWFKSSKGEDLKGVIFDSNLYVEKAIENVDDEEGPFLLVLGNCYAKNIYKGGSEFYINNNCIIDNLIYGHNNYGSMKVLNKTKSQYIIGENHFFEFNQLDNKTVKINNFSSSGSYDFYKDDIKRVFVKEVLDESENLKIEKFIYRLNNNKRVMKPNAKRSFEILSEEIENLSNSKNENLELDLEFKNLKEFPSSIFRIKNLKKLFLRGNPINFIPEKIEQLQHLEILDLNSCSIKTLPNTIGNLKRLKQLKLDHNLGLIIPKSISKLINLESLSLYQITDVKPVDFPQEICNLTGLKKLFIGSNSFKTIPESILNLKNLEELDLDRSLCYLNRIPDLSGLKKLKKIHADGRKTFKTRPNPKQAILKAFFNIPNLVELNIDRHSIEKETLDSNELVKIKDNLSYDLDRFKEIKDKLIKKDEKSNNLVEIVGEPLRKEHLYGIGNLKNLKIINLSFNDLESLPQDFYNLKKLIKIDLRYNRLSKEECYKIMKLYPKVEIDFRNQKVLKENENDDDFIKMENHINKANSIRSRNLKEAIIEYDKALEFYVNGKVTNEYNLIYIHYSKMWIYSQLGYHIEKITKDELNEYKKMCLKEAKFCLELIPPNFCIWHFTDEGEFHLETIVFASNVIAYNYYENSTNNEELKKALIEMERAVELAQNERHYYIVDTKVRILLKLNKKEEAFKIVKSILDKTPRFKDFQDIKKDKEYLSFQSNR